MTTRDIRPNRSDVTCDVCGRTLLRGERSEVFIAGGSRHQVCELCKPHALHEGWIREGALPDYANQSGPADRRRPVFGRRRRGRDQGDSGPDQPATLDDALSGERWPADGQTPSRRARERRRERPASQRPTAQPDGAASESGGPRHVRAVPTSGENKIAAAVDSFNGTEHVRTVAGVARSLGAPVVAVIPDPVHSTQVAIIASWELCWYRYEVDLSDERGSVRLNGQGYELSELSEPEQIANVACDESGQLHTV